MNSHFAWFLGTLVSDGSIVRPIYRGKGDETHIAYCMHINDVDILEKIKRIVKTKSKILLYPHYQSPQCKIYIHDKKDIIAKYNSIKTSIPDDIAGFERHFLRGICDGDGCLSYRKNRNSFRINLINQNKDIINWCSKVISEQLLIEYKEPKFKSRDNIYIVEWEGRIGKLIIWWLYHGDIQNMVLARKHNFYVEKILSKQIFSNPIEEFLYAVGATQEPGKILPNIDAGNTLKWCHIIQKQLPYTTTPIFSNKGQSKYYYLHVPKEKS